MSSANTCIHCILYELLFELYNMLYQMIIYRLQSFAIHLDEYVYQLKSPDFSFEICLIPLGHFFGFVISWFMVNFKLFQLAFEGKSEHAKCVGFI